MKQREAAFFLWVILSLILALAIPTGVAASGEDLSWTDKADFSSVDCPEFGNDRKSFARWAECEVEKVDQRSSWSKNKGSGAGELSSSSDSHVPIKRGPSEKNFLIQMLQNLNVSLEGCDMRSSARSFVCS